MPAQTRQAIGRAEITHTHTRRERMRERYTHVRMVLKCASVWVGPHVYDLWENVGGCLSLERCTVRVYTQVHERCCCCRTLCNTHSHTHTQHTITHILEHNPSRQRFRRVQPSCQRTCICDISFFTVMLMNYPFCLRSLAEATGSPRPSGSGWAAAVFVVPLVGWAASWASLDGIIPADR